MTTPFGDRLAAAISKKGTPILLGLDPHLDLLPSPFDGAADAHRDVNERAELIGDFCCQLVDVCADRVPAVKPQSAFFEQLGSAGVAAFERVCDHARAAGLLVVGDVKRGDIASTADAYARAFFDPPMGIGACDAITVSPYLGADTLEPFAKAAKTAGGGLFVLVRTSNPGSGAWQGHGAPPVSELVAAGVHALGADTLGASGYSSIGAVCGATHPDQLTTWRQLMPHAFLLLPGYGAQGATAKDVSGAFRPDGTGAIVASSRGIAFAYRTGHTDWKTAASEALDHMRSDLAGALPGGA
ncbi:Orotidine 5'-phosphate decarboxylase [Planctomycetes bacterium Pla163]|uniref:Orotidine 5'-phosphate decarboxylase n=1 Tax=Rohdeia mirabilis TaxID=2528008 RepID=A0A518D590_9BACT|nr:Orotidine 5'-phosphate decarboxylase [Planctomycetes bacterium Pla163]